jgi:very-short-patch-repair endonuclease
MFKYERKKHPARVRAGQEAHRRRIAGMSDDEYRAAQRALRERAIAKHPNMSRRGAQSANTAQLREWGEDGYRRQRQDAYTRCVEEHGAQFAKEAIRRAHMQGRLKRLHNPTPGEAALRAALADRGYRVRLDDSFDLHTWRSRASAHTAGPIDAFAEAQVGPYYCDIVIPTCGIAIEVYGGVHVLTRERDEQRSAFLETQGLTVIVLHDTDNHQLTTEEIHRTLDRVEHSTQLQIHSPA